jgi:hypothetical protein
MFKEEIKKLTEKVESIENEYDGRDLDNFDTDKNESLESEVYELESEIDNYFDVVEGAQFSQLEKLRKRILYIKQENNFYDAEDELDMMFPNRHADDFDEDSMSYDSVFGED